tara:strand:+ start:241 stop:414 length:174 start_codon:yes stop_codon:yes gene_type:complete
MKLTKKRTLTEIEQLKKEFLDFNETEYVIELTTDGKIINVNTNDKKLQKFLKEKGFN